jgi:hypothetical protein
MLNTLTHPFIIHPTDPHPIDPWTFKTIGTIYAILILKKKILKKKNSDEGKY